ncbi:MAG: histidinol-phosphate aminotransferase [Blastocatellia bacterium]|jgi:histidinol-phosphate aminotransferase|nr:histidinol-phosphate aminotransferase [Blastocatellia bacterium]
MMSKTLASIKTRVCELRPYSLSPDVARIKLNQNENPWDTPVKIKQETLRRISDCAWSRYPNFAPRRLHERLADFSGWTAEGIVAGNGSNELIQALLMVTVGEGKRVLINEPTFALYRQITTVLGGEIISLPLNADLSYDVTALTAAVADLQPEVTIVCSPNNPTGGVLNDDDLLLLLESTNGLVVVDEAYHEFAEHSVVPLLREHDNLVVLRTFSKAIAMAGLRAGYLLAAPELATEIRKAVLPYNLNIISQTAAEVAVEMYEDELRPLVRKIIAERERLHDALSRLNGLTPVRSRANFILVRSTIEPKQVFAELLKRNILIRDVSGYPMLSEYFRFSVGTPEENELLLEALREIFGARGQP